MSLQYSVIFDRANNVDVSEKGKYTKGVIFLLCMARPCRAGSSLFCRCW